MVKIFGSVYNYSIGYIMIIIIILALLVLFLYNRHNVDFLKIGLNSKYGRYILISKEEFSSFISYSNILFVDINGKYITPHQLTVNPRLSFGNGITPKIKDDTNKLILVETDIDDFPSVEYDFGANIHISKIIIINGTKNVLITLLNEKKEIIFTHNIIDTKDVYTISLT
jgi:hypothetical protein